MKTTFGALAIAVALIAGAAGASATPTGADSFTFESVFGPKN